MALEREIHEKGGRAGHAGIGWVITTAGIGCTLGPMNTSLLIAPVVLFAIPAAMALNEGRPLAAVMYMVAGVGAGIFMRRDANRQAEREEQVSRRHHRRRK